MATLLLKTRLAFGAYGVSTYERMAMGVPSVILTLTKEQDKLSQILDEDGNAFNLGSINDIDAGIS